MLGISSRLVQVHQAVSPKQHKDDAERIAGRMGEKKVIEQLISHGVYQTDLFQSLRVPDEFQTRRHELDLVVLTGCGLYCIEIKNWGGSITTCKDDMYWEQTKIVDTSSHHSKQLQYPNPVTEIKTKTNILRNHLIRAGICLGEKKFFPRVILVNEAAVVDEDIKKNECVITVDKLKTFLVSFTRTVTQVVTDPFIPYFLRGQLSYTQMDQVRSALNQVGTWDVLFLNGGRQIVGDFKGCSQLNCNRKEVEELSFIHQRNANIAAVWAVLGYSPTTNVVLYKRGGSGWINREVTASVKIPYNLDIGFRIAGESIDSKIPANDILNVILSK